MTRLYWYLINQYAIDMKKNLIIGLLTIISLSSMTYGYFQKAWADEQEALAIENSKIAREAEIKARTKSKGSGNAKSAFGSSY
jgi:hypothetical protein